MTKHDSASKQQPNLHQDPQGNTTATTSSSSVTPGATQDAPGRQPSSSPAASAELASAKITITKALRHFADFPIPGIDFIDIMPLFHDPAAHETLLRALELQVAELFPSSKPEIIVGLDARGFLFGPALALRLGAGFTAVRKKGKLPGPCVTAEYVKEYGKDFFQMQRDGIANGQKVLVVDDIIATGTCAKPRSPVDLATHIFGRLDAAGSILGGMEN